MLGSGRWPPLAVPSAPAQPLGWSSGKYLFFLRTGYPAPREGTHARMLRNVPLRLAPRGGSSSSVALASQLAIPEATAAAAALPAVSQQTAGAAAAARHAEAIIDADIVDAFDDWHRERARSILHRIHFHAGDFCGLWRSPKERVSESVARLHYDPYERRTARLQPIYASAGGGGGGDDGDSGAAAAAPRKLTAEEVKDMCSRLATDGRRGRGEPSHAEPELRPRVALDAAKLQALVDRLAGAGGGSERAAAAGQPPGSRATAGGAEPVAAAAAPKKTADEVAQLVDRLSRYDETKWPPESWRNRRLAKAAAHGRMGNARPAAGRASAEDD